MPRDQILAPSFLTCVRANHVFIVHTRSAVNPSLIDWASILLES